MAQSSEAYSLLHANDFTGQYFCRGVHDTTALASQAQSPVHREPRPESVTDFHHLFPLLPDLLTNSTADDATKASQKISDRSPTAVLDDIGGLSEVDSPLLVLGTSQLVTDNRKPPENESTRTAEKIIEILERYRMAPQDSLNSRWVARSQFLKKIMQCIEQRLEVQMALPAFPFKSPNKAVKVLGDLPDCGEETALLHLNSMCQGIADLHRPGAKLYIVSDGLMYNDILGVSDQEVWNYGQCLRKLSETLGCHHIQFLRLFELLGQDTHVQPLSELEYLRDAPAYRRQIFETYLSESFDVDTFISSEKDATLTYRGYLKFLEGDLENTGVSPEIMSKSQKKKCHEQIAKTMIKRGKAFANAIQARLSSYIRLSIHSSTESSKLSICIIPQYNNCAMTPWHSSLVRALDGSVVMSHALKVPAKTHNLIVEGGRPSYFRERSELFDWSMDVQFKYMYPCGILILPRSLCARYSFHNIHMQKVRALAEKCSPIVLRGFIDTTDHHTYITKAYDAGQPRNAEIKASKVEEGKCHCKVDEDKSGPPTAAHASEHCYQTPRFRYIASLSEPRSNSNDTVFASSRLFWQNLPSRHSHEKLSKLNWSCESSSSSNDDTPKVFPLVIPHPTNAERRCVMWHNAWHQRGKHSYQTKVTIQNGSQHYASVIDSVLSDRRVCLYFAWEKGDVVLSDNIAMLHSGTGFDDGPNADFWQLDLD